jgi:hypothetical protein
MTIVRFKMTGGKGQKWSHDVIQRLKLNQEFLPQDLLHHHHSELLDHLITHLTVRTVEEVTQPKIVRNQKLYAIGVISLGTSQQIVLTHQYHRDNLHHHTVL